MKKRASALFLALALTLSLAACGGKTEPEAPQSVTGAGESKGYGGAIKVEVTLSADKSTIEDVKVTAEGETESIGGKAIELLSADMKEHQTINLDAVTGATLSSNGFLAAAKAAIEAAGADAEKFSAAVEKNAQEQTLDADVVVVGAGGAGMTAAIAAAQAGKKVVILEKTAIAGGNTSRATGGMNAAATKFQQNNTFGEDAGVEKTLSTTTDTYPELAGLVATVRSQYDQWKADGSKGYFDSPELMVINTMVGGYGVNNIDLVTTLAENSAEAVEWLDEVGVHLSNVGAAGGASVKRSHRPVDAEGKILAVGSYMVPALEKICTDNGVQIIYNAPATEILMQDGKAVGVKAEGYTVNAKSVVLASGGFGANLEMVAQLKPELKGFVTTNAAGITGDGIRMAQAVGAATVDMDQIQIHPTVEQATSSLITESIRGDGAILVNAEGQRFYDEVSTRDKVSAAELAQTGSYAWLIVDQKMVEVSNVIQGYIKKGYMVKGETLEELAAAMDVPADAFTATMEKWNGCVAAKSDPDFGRTSFTEPLDTAPYYAVKIAPGVHHTMGGVKINTSTEVVDTNGNVIPGLYAAGEITGGVHGANRLGGNAVADIIVFGKIAGEQAAAYAK